MEKDHRPKQWSISHLCTTESEMEKLCYFVPETALFVGNEPKHQIEAIRFIFPVQTIVADLLATIETTILLLDKSLGLCSHN